jgi:hypothetical protein
MGKNQDPGSGINIPDPQHWFYDINGYYLRSADVQKLGAKPSFFQAYEWYTVKVIIQFNTVPKLSNLAFKPTV